MQLGEEKLHYWSPHRAPEWRWLTAQKAIAERRCSPALEKDKEVVKAVKFLEIMSVCQDDWDFEDLYRKQPDAYLALSFWVPPSRYNAVIATERPTIVEARRQATLEAYLLAGLPHDEVANKLCLTPEAVMVYENWFYDFRPRLGSVEWVSTQGIRGDVAGTSGCSFENLLRLYGWRYGAKMVDDLLAGTDLGDKTFETLRRDTLYHLTKNSAIMSRATYHHSVTFEAASRAQELHDRNLMAKVEAGQDFRSSDEAQWFTTISDEMQHQQDWKIQGILPAELESQIPKAEHRLAVRLGFEPDLSNVTP